MNKLIILIVVLLLLIGGTGFVVYRVVAPGSSKPVAVRPTDSPEALPTVDPSIGIELVQSKTDANTVDLTVKGLKGKMTSIGYEISYDSQGLIKGVNSGTKPIDVAGKDDFTRDIYLGTCSRNVCKPDVGVTKVSVVLEFTDKDGNKSEFSKDYEL